MSFELYLYVENFQKVPDAAEPVDPAEPVEPAYQKQFNSLSLLRRWHHSPKRSWTFRFRLERARKLFHLLIKTDEHLLTHCDNHWKGAN